MCTGGIINAVTSEFDFQCLLDMVESSMKFSLSFVKAAKIVECHGSELQSYLFVK